MWSENPFEKSGTGGGFMASSTDSPAGDKQGKVRRSNNVFPVSIKQLLDFPNETFSIEGFEANTVTIVGLVLKVDTTTTKISMTLDDQTGVMDCVNYLGTDEDNRGAAPPIELCEGSYGRIVGALRKSKDVKYLIIFKATPVRDLNELNCHLLEVIQTGISLKKMREAETLKSKAGEQLDNTFSNSMIKQGLGGGPTGTGTATGATGGGIRGFSTSQNTVLRVIAQCRDEQGLHKDEIINSLRGVMPLKEISDVLEFLSNEGHIFSTLDEDHYKATDAQFV